MDMTRKGGSVKSIDRFMRERELSIAPSGIDAGDSQVLGRIARAAVMVTSHIDNLERRVVIVPRSHRVEEILILTFDRMQKVAEDDQAKGPRPLDGG